VTRLRRPAKTLPPRTLGDLASTQASPGLNVHFQDTLEGDRLLFDYRLRPGVVTRRNALDLMRLVGIDVSKA